VSEYREVPASHIWGRRGGLMSRKQTLQPRAGAWAGGVKQAEGIGASLAEHSAEIPFWES